MGYDAEKDQSAAYDPMARHEISLSCRRDDHDNCNGFDDGMAGYCHCDCHDAAGEGA